MDQSKTDGKGFPVGESETGQSVPSPPPHLILLPQRLHVRFPERIEEILAALLPCRLEFRRGDVPVRPALPANRTQVLAEIFHGRSAEEPVAVVDLVNHQA